MNKIFRYGFYLFASALFYACAIQVAPQGGEKDITPPVLQQVTPASGTLNFTGNTIEFEFDENIQLKDLTNKLVVSPPLKTAPVVKPRKNKLLVTLEDTLRRSTTYTFNFGDAVVDLNEGNAIQDLQYVISTGDVIDSLQLSGRVIRGEDLQPENGMFVMLYPATAVDSAPYLERPLYFSRTNASGRFTITNLADGNYRLFALSESNQNYLYDDPAERIAFEEKLIAVPDSARQLFSYRQFGATSLVRSSADGPGKIRFVFNRPFPDAEITCLQHETIQLQQTDISERKDSVTIWYTNLSADSALFRIRTDEKVDTVTLQLKKYEPKPGKKSNFELQCAVVTGPGSSLSMQQPIVITSNHPVREVNSKLMTLYNDSTVVPQPLAFNGNTAKNNFESAINWVEEEQYRLQIFPGAFTDIFGLTNDTLEQNITIRPSTAFGTVTIRLSGLPDAEYFILQLVDDKEAVFRQTTFSGDTTAYFSFLQPGTYRLKLIDDRNRNGRWDEGDYLTKRQPETVRYYDEKIPVRANWDVELKWAIKK